MSSEYPSRTPTRTLPPNVCGREGWVGDVKNTRALCGLVDGLGAAFSLLPCLAPLLPEEFLQERLTLLFEYAPQDFYSMVEPALSWYVEDRTAGAGLGVPCAEHESCDARLHDGSGAHGTGFQRHVERGLGEPPGS